MTLDEINVLGNIFNTTYGRSGTSNSPTSSVTTTMQGETAIVKYVTQTRIMSGHEGRLIEQDEREKAEIVLKKFVSDTKNTFKKHCGRELTMKVENTTDYLDPVTFPTIDGRVGHGFFKMTKVYTLK